MQFQEFRPPSKFDTFMNKYTVPILIVVIGTVLGAVLLGKVLLVDFNLVMFGWGIILTFIIGYYVRYFNKTRRDFQDQHEKDIAAMRQAVDTMKAEHLKIIDSERKLFDQWQQRVITANEQQKVHFEKLINEQKQTIEDIKRELESLQRKSANLENGFSRHLEDHTREQQKIMKQINELEEKFGNGSI